MKRLTAMLLVLFIVMSLVPNVCANDIQTEVIYYEDGSYVIITLEQVYARASRTNTKKMRNYNSDGELVWMATLTGSFTYDNVTAKCTNANCSITFYDSSYYQVSKTAVASGASAIATFQIGKQVAGVTTSENTYNLSISCTPDGNVY